MSRPIEPQLSMIRKQKAEVGKQKTVSPIIQSFLFSLFSLLSSLFSLRFSLFSSLLSLLSPLFSFPLLLPSTISLSKSLFKAAESVFVLYPTENSSERKSEQTGGDHCSLILQLYSLTVFAKRESKVKSRSSTHVRRRVFNKNDYFNRWLFFLFSEYQLVEGRGSSIVFKQVVKTTLKPSSKPAGPS